MIYFDNAATTKIRKSALEAMLPFFEAEYANPSGIYLPAGKARRGVEEARDTMASLLFAERDEIVFTSGGSESNNLAIRGYCMANRGRGRHIVTSLTEHPSVLNTFRALEREGFEVTYISPNINGIISFDAFSKELRNDTIFASVMHANNETGVVQDIKELAAAAHERHICFHTDAVQSFGHIPTDVKELQADMLSISSHKFGGPKGCGMLYRRRDIKLEPLIYGGEQERGMRAGTENVPGIVGMVKAATEAVSNLEMDSKKVLELREHLVDRVLSEIEDSSLNGDRINRLPGNANFTFKGVQGESVIIRLSAAGVCASTGSACTAIKHEPSHVLTAMGISDADASASVRFSLNQDNTIDEVDSVADTLKQIIHELRLIRRY